MLKDPEVGFIREHKMEINVVFPAPLGPKSPKISFSSMNRLKSDKE